MTPETFWFLFYFLSKKVYFASNKNKKEPLKLKASSLLNLTNWKEWRNKWKINFRKDSLLRCPVRKLEIPGWYLPCLCVTHEQKPEKMINNRAIGISFEKCKERLCGIGKDQPWSRPFASELKFTFLSKYLNLQIMVKKSKFYSDNIHWWSFIIEQRLQEI